MRVKGRKDIIDELLETCNAPLGWTLLAGVIMVVLALIVL